MSTPVVVPKAGFAMTEAELAEWCVTDGAEVSSGEIVCLLESDKTTIEVEATAAGRITLQATPGDTVSVGSTIAEIT